MVVIKPLEKNKRTCASIDCGAIYVINGDPSGYWQYKGGISVNDDNEIAVVAPIEGLCEFCRDKKK